MMSITSKFSVPSISKIDELCSSIWGTSQVNLAQEQYRWGKYLSPDCSCQSPDFRYLIVGGQIADKIPLSTVSKDAEGKFDWFVNCRILNWQPSKRFIIDVCDTPSGIKVSSCKMINYVASTPLPGE